MKKDEFARRYFSAKTVRLLAKKGMRVVSATWVPGADGSFANGEEAYLVDDNGTGRLRSFLEVLQLAGTSW